MRAILFVMVLTSSLFSNPMKFKGVWKGQGTYVLENDVTHCSDFTMEFDATESTFSFVSGQRNCDKHTEEFYRVDMSYRDGKVYFGEMEVGSYTENSITTSFRAPDGDTFRNWRMNMRVTGDQLLYEESRIYDGEETPFINFAGIMIAE